MMTGISVCCFTTRVTAAALLGISGFLVGGLLAPLGGLGSAALGVLMLGFALTGLLVHAFLKPRTPITEDR